MTYFVYSVGFDRIRAHRWRKLCKSANEKEPVRPSSAWFWRAHKKEKIDLYIRLQQIPDFKANRPFLYVQDRSQKTAKVWFCLEKSDWEYSGHKIKLLNEKHCILRPSQWCCHFGTPTFVLIKRSKMLKYYIRRELTWFVITGTWWLVALTKSVQIV